MGALPPEVRQGLPGAGGPGVGQPVPGAGGQLLTGALAGGCWA